jgi:Tfp pilus assembly protein PilP
MRSPKTMISAYGALFIGLASVCWAQGSSQEAAAPKAVDEKAVADSATASQRGRRDPFEPLVRKAGGAGQVTQRVLPAGPAGVEVATLKLDGVVKSPGGMVAVISTPQGRVYFVREGQRLYDGVIERITLDGMVLRERGQDAFGKPIERLVTKRL